MVVFKGKGGGEARNASQVAREGWRPHHPAFDGETTPCERIQPDSRELLPGLSNETAGADAPVFFACDFASGENACRQGEWFLRLKPDFLLSLINT